MHPDQPVSREQRLIGLARVAIAGLIWGSIPLIIRTADGASVVKVFFRVACAGVVVLAFMAATGRLQETFSLTREKFIQVAGQGLILTLNWFMFLTALDMTDVATAELLAYTGPVFVASLAPLVTKEAFDKRIVIPLGIAMIGMVVILVPHGAGITGRTEMIGAGLAFASAITYAILLLRSKKILRGISSLSLMLVQYTIASIVLSPFVIAAYLRGDGPTGTTSYAALVTLGVFHTAFAGLIFLGGLRRVRTDQAAILTYVEPVAAVVLASIFLAEPFTITTVLGGALVVAGGVIVAKLDTRPITDAVPIEAAGTEHETGERPPQR